MEIRSDLSVISELKIYTDNGGPKTWAGSYAYGWLTAAAARRGLIPAELVTDCRPPAYTLKPHVDAALASLTTTMDNTTYRIVRIYFDKTRRSRTIKRGLTLAEAQAHCRNPETNSRTATGRAALALTRRVGCWWDAYDADR